MEAEVLQIPFGAGIYCRRWAAPQANAAVVMIHGLGEHGGRYTHVAQFFNQTGASFYAPDLPGHGKSGGKRGHIRDYNEFMDLIALMVETAAKEVPGKPVYLYGHSMGGNLVLNFLLRRKPSIKGAIVSDPWLRTAFAPPAVKVALAKIVSKIYPAYTDRNGLVTSHLSRDPEVVKAYNADPLVHDKITANLFLAGKNAGEWALEHASELNTPLLLLFGTGDQITSFEAGKIFASRAKATFIPFEGFYHEIHNEPQKQQVFDQIKDWISAL